ncbi:hypothetical protein BD770DRAFT_447981 [Pilaira anomala]|nr:hypothetical protein BD770DRAFT_447981 [Pilaira anomala]
MAGGINLKTFPLPRNYLSGTDLMSKLLLVDEDVIGPNAKDQYVAIPTEWIDFTRSDVASKVTLEDQDQPADARIEAAVNILNNVIAYVDEIAQKRHLENSLSGFEFADKNGYIPWKAQFQQWKILGRFEQYKSYKSAQSAYHRSKEKQKQSTQTEHQQDTPVVAPSPSSSSSSPPGTRQPSS